MNRITSLVYRSIRTCSTKVPPFSADSIAKPAKSTDDPFKVQRTLKLVWIHLSYEDDADFIYLNKKYEYIAKYSISHEDVDIVVSDIDENDLIRIGNNYCVKDLSVGSFPSSPFPVTGKIHHWNSRFMVPLLCINPYSKKAKPVNVWFLINTSSPFTFLTVKSLEAIVGKNNVVVEGEYPFYDCHRLHIQEPSKIIECYVSKRNFSNVNILGADVLEALKLSLCVDWKNREFKLTRMNSPKTTNWWNVVFPMFFTQKSC